MFISLFFTSTEPILRLRKTSAMRMLHSFDHSGEDQKMASSSSSSAARKRPYDDALGNGDHQNNDEELKEHVSQMMGGEDGKNVDPPARERPSVSSLRFIQQYTLYL